MGSTPRLVKDGARDETGDVEFTGTARFEVRRRLGAGGMGVVYEVHDRERGMAMALKTLRRADGQGIYRFKSEFRALADLGHRNLVRLGELFHEAGRWFFTMELVPGCDFVSWVRGAGRPRDPTYAATLELAKAPTTPLAEAPAGGGAFDEGRLRDALRQLALGVSALHAAGKLHRDLKPNNVMVTPKGRVVVLDLGLVAEIGNGPASDPNVVGTAAYMAPEQASTPVLSAAADWYSVGVMLFEALTGRLPFSGAPLDVLMRKQREAAPRPSHVAPDIPADLDDLCAELLARDPAARCAGPAVLAALGAGGDVADPTVTPVPPAAPLFVGRDRELAVLEAALDEVTTSGALTLYVRGESGIGKTALVRQFLAGVAERRPGVLALSARCYERESVPFKALDGIIDGLTRHLVRKDPLDVAMLLEPDVAALARIFPVLLRVPAIARAVLPKTRSPFELRNRAFVALRELLRKLAAEHPIVLTIDDYQWADADSHALLDELFDPPGAPRLLLVATRRALAGSVYDMRPLPGVSRELVLGGLAPEHGRELVVRLAGGGGAAELRAIAEDAKGHPLFIQELVRHGGARGDGAGPVRLDDALMARIDCLDGQARRVLEATAVAGGPAAQATIAHAARLEPASCAKSLDQLRAAMLVRTRGARGADVVECYHDRVRMAVLSRLSTRRRREYHALVADHIEAAGGAHKDALHLVRHLEAAGETARAALVALHAAAQASEALAFDQAADLYGTALRLGNHEPRERRVLARRRAEALAHAGRGPEAAHAYLAAAEATDDADERFTCRRLAVEQFLISGYIEKGLGTLRSVLAEVGLELPRSRGASIRSLLWHWTVLRVRGLRWRPRRAHEIPAREVMRFEVYRTVSLGLAMVDSVLGADFQARATLLALRIGDPRRVAHALGFNALYHASRGGRRLPRAHALAAEGQRLEREVGDPWLEAWMLSCRGVIEYFSGHYRTAAALLEAAEREFRDQTVSTTSEIAHVRAFQLLSLRRLGAYRELATAYHAYVRDATRRGDRYAETTFVRAANVIWLAEDDPARARAELGRTTWSPPEGGYHLQHWFELRARVDLALYGSEPADAAMIAGLDAFPRTQFARMQVLRAENEWMRGRVAVLDGDWARAPSAARRLRGEGIDYARAWGLLLDAAIADAAGDRVRAGERLREAVAAAEREMPVIAEVARRRAAELAHDPVAIRHVDAWLAEQGVRRPQGIVAMLAPGFAPGA